MRRRGSKKLRNGKRPRLRLEGYKAAGCHKKRMMKMTLRMSRQPREGAAKLHLQHQLERDGLARQCLDPDLHATTHACRRLTGVRCTLTSCLFLLRFLLQAGGSSCFFLFVLLQKLLHPCQHLPAAFGSVSAWRLRCAPRAELLAAQ